MPVRFDVITLFPEMFAGVLGGSILDRAARPISNPSAPADPQRVRPPVASYHLHQLRDFSADAKHGKVDRPPYGGGAGMVLQCQPLWDAVRHVEAIEPSVRPHRVFLTPTGRPLTQRVAEELAEKTRLLLICGHYEGFDQRVLDALHDEGGLDEISVGDVVLSGGELPAMTLIDAVVRLLPGALGDADSHRHDSFSPGVGRLLDHPHYTHPPTWQGRDVPEVLRSGDHGKVAAWRAEQSRELTEARRPDLLGIAGESDAAAKRPVAVIREARRDEVSALTELHREAFGGETEARIVEALSAGHDVAGSVVAELGGRIVGHAVLTTASLADQSGLRGLLALGPVAVRPAYRGRGLGTALVSALIGESRDARAARLFVLGDPAWYGRFGFAPASSQGFRCAWTDGSAFAVLDLRPDLALDAGEVRWPAPFYAE